MLVKYILLQVSALLSTGLFGIGFFFGMSSLHLIDVAINASCLLLMSPIHYNCYACLCKICHNTMEGIWLKHMKHNSTQMIIKNISENVDTPDNPKQIGEPTAMTVQSGYKITPEITQTQNEGRQNIPINIPKMKSNTENNIKSINVSSFDIKLKKYSTPDVFSFTSRKMEKNDSIIQKHLAHNQVVIAQATKGGNIHETPN